MHVLQSETKIADLVQIGCNILLQRSVLCCVCLYIITLHVILCTLKTCWPWKFCLCKGYEMSSGRDILLSTISYRMTWIGGQLYCNAHMWKGSSH